MARIMVEADKKQLANGFQYYLKINLGLLLIEWLPFVRPLIQLIFLSFHVNLRTR